MRRCFNQAPGVGFLFSIQFFQRFAAAIFLALGVAACSAGLETADAPEREEQEPTAAEPATPQQPDAEAITPELPATVTQQPEVVLPDLGPAPDITNQVWLNTDRPLDLAALRGKVVLVEFWTFG